MKVAAPGFLETFEPLQSALKILSLEIAHVGTKTRDTRECSTRKAIFERFIKRNTYKIFLHLTLSLCHIAYMYVVDFEKLRESKKTYMVTYRISNNLSFFASQVGLAMLWVRDSSRLEVINKFLAVDLIIFGADRDRDSYKKQQKLPAVIFSALLVMLFASLLGFQLMFHMTTVERLVAIANQVKHIVVLVITGRFMNLVFLIHLRFGTLNDKLRNHPYIKLITKDTSDSQTVMSSRLDQNSFLTAPLSGGSNAFKNVDECELSLDIECDGYVKLIVSLRSVYNKLCNIITFINHAYGIPLVLILLSFYATLISWLLYTLLTLFRPSYINEVKFAYRVIFVTSLWFSSFALQIMVLIYVCSTVLEKVKVIKNTVNDLMLEPKLGVQASKQLLLFSDLISKRKLEFSGGGFFIIEHPLLITITESAMTYVLVLLQFSSP